MQSAALDFIVDGSLSFQSPLPLELLTLWRGKCREGLLPRRSDFDWTELSPHFGQLCVVEVMPSREDLRYRLIGSRIVEVVGRDMTGRLVSETLPPAALAVYFELMDSPRPLRTHGRLHWRGKNFIRHETLLLPLAEDGRTVDQFLLEMAFLS